MASAGCLTILVALCIAGGLAVEWTKLRVSLVRYHEIPFTLEELIQSQNYSLMVRDEELNLDFYSFENDPRVAVGVDSYGNIGGLRVSYIKADLPSKGDANNLSFPYEFYDKPYYTSGNFLNFDVWYVDVLFVHPETLKAGGRPDTEGLLGEDVFVKMNGDWMTLPKYECDATSLGFTLQNCIPVMGLHYFYDIKTDTDCVGLQPLFVLYENGEMIGMGVATLGMQTAAPKRTWFENSPREFFMNTVPNRPDCLLELLDNYGVTALHFFFKEDHLSTPCATSVC